MGTIFSCVGSCVGSCIGSALCSIQTGKTSRLPYVILFLLSTIVAIVMGLYGQQKLNVIGNFNIAMCPNQQAADVCYGNQAVYRVSFGLVGFFFLHLLVCFIQPGFHNSLQFFKIIGLVGILAGCFFIPYKVFDIYIYFCWGASILFIGFELIILCDFVYRANDFLVEFNNSFVNFMILVGSFLLFAGSIIAQAFLFKYYTMSGSQNCQLQKCYISFTIIISFVFTIISITEQCEHGALLPSALICFHSTYLLFSALSADPSSCNAVKPQRHSPEQYIGLVIACLSLVYASLMMSKRATDSQNSSETFEEQPASIVEVQQQRDSVEVADEKKVLLNNSDLAGQKILIVEKASQEIQETPFSKSDSFQNVIFHFVMLTVSMYMCMCLTNQGSNVDALSDGDFSQVSQSRNIMWVKIAGQQFIFIVYVWSLIAPYVLSSRDFSDVY